MKNSIRIILFICIFFAKFNVFANEQVIIFLNGTSSAGKTSIAKKLQDQLHGPTLLVGFDHFVVMLNPDFLFNGINELEGYKCIQDNDVNEPSITVKVGPVGQEMQFAIHRGIRTLANSKFNLVVDEIFFHENDFPDYQQLFKDFKVYFIAIKPPLEVAVKRELERGDRMIGLARGLYKIVYGNLNYDLEIDSSKFSSEESAKQILNYINDTPNPTAFHSNKRS